MFDKPNKKALPLIERLVLNFDKYDISTFKTACRDIVEISDDRAPEDRTDFSFTQRRVTD